VRRKRDEQAIGTLATSTLDALCDPLRIRSPVPGDEPMIDTCVVSSIDTDIFVYLFVVRSPDCSSYSVDQVVCSIEVGSCSLQEEQML
jgi:hypothetical protein